MIFAHSFPPVQTPALRFVISANRLDLTNKITHRTWTSDVGFGMAILADQTTIKFSGAEGRDPLTGLKYRWTVLEPKPEEKGSVVRLGFTLTATSGDVNIARLNLAGLRDVPVLGSVQGSPLAMDGVYAGVEDPMSRGAEGVSFVERKHALAAGQSVTYSVVYGVAPHGQLRRWFQQYVNAERPRPYEPFLHYNSWYDIGYGTQFTADQCIQRVNAFGQALVRDRGVKMSSFLFDDGWDDTSTVWKFNKDFPDGFTPVAGAAKKFDAAPGAWLSPWGGYSKARQERLAAGAQGGMEIDRQGYALSGPKYFKRFHEVTMDMVKRQGINQFKFDGTGSPDKTYPGSAFDSDFSAAISLISDLRAAKPDLFINLTTGTWPSPFWTRYADSIWRGGEDHSFAGEGTWRQKWITYRDGDTYHGIVQKGPLYPLNSLMLHGLIYAQHAKHLGDDPGHDFGAEVKTYFSTGTQLQEMYITPTLLSGADWDVLAMGAKWSRAHKEELRDSHWVGGDPLKGDVYGWAGWHDGHAYLTLRNPSPKAQLFSVEPSLVFELPTRAAYGFKPTLETEAGAFLIGAGKSHVVKVEPFQVLSWETAVD